MTGAALCLCLSPRGCDGAVSLKLREEQGPVSGCQSHSGSAGGRSVAARWPCPGPGGVTEPAPAMPVTGGVCHGGQAGGLHPLLLHTDWRAALPVSDPRAAIGQESRQSGRKAGPGASAAGSSRGLPMVPAEDGGRRPGRALSSAAPAPPAGPRPPGGSARPWPHGEGQSGHCGQPPALRGREGRRWDGMGDPRGSGGRGAGSLRVGRSAPALRLFGLKNLRRGYGC